MRELGSQTAMNRDELRVVFERLGLKRGDTVFIHSSLSSIGYVEGGAATVVQALLGVVHAEGTLAAPAFTFRSDLTVLDLAKEPSGMGRISEKVRTYPGARRSAHLLHSVAAVGARAEEITRIHGPSAWAADGPFWKLCDLASYILLLGVSYETCTLFHVIEQMVQVPYRHWSHRAGMLRESDGTEGPLPAQVFAPLPGFAGKDLLRGVCGLGRPGRRPRCLAIATAGEALASDAIQGACARP